MPKRKDIGTPTTTVRLTRKYAEMIDGIDLKAAEVGDRLELPRREAQMLMAEGWAEKAEKVRATAHDKPKRRRRQKS